MTPWDALAAALGAPSPDDVLRKYLELAGMELRADTGRAAAAELGRAFQSASPELVGVLLAHLLGTWATVHHNTLNGRLSVPPPPSHADGRS